MKKMIILLSLFSISLTLTGCGNTKQNKQVKEDIPLSKQTTIDDKDSSIVCTLDSFDSKNNYNIGSKYVIYSDNNIATKVVSQELVESNDKEVLNYFEQYLNENYELSSNYNGYEYNITNSNNRITADVTINYKDMDIESFINDYPNLKEYLNDNNEFTIDSMKDIYESMGATCTRK